MEVIRYRSSYFQEWNDFLQKAKNATFLFHRNFCEYHADRFTDHSVVLIDKGEIIAVFIANQELSTIYSHAGLSYGGLIVLPNLSLHKLLSCFYYLLAYYTQQGIEKILYKQMPYFYHQQPCFEEEYALFLLNATIVRRDTNFVINLQQGFHPTKRRRRSILKAEQKNIQILEQKDFTEYWQKVLSPTLQSKFGVLPVHSLEEISNLHQKFPKHIRQFSAFLDGEIVAGTTIFENLQVAHAQYIAANAIGKSVGAIDKVFAQLITTIYKDFRYFSFGITNEQQGRYLNKGLTEWKESFGAKVWIHNFYSINAQNYSLLKDFKC
jgi:hypothetical protein